MKNVGSGIVIQDKRILLIKRSKDKKSLAGFWALPGGRQEENETPEETTIREVKEEVGLEFEALKLFTENTTEEIHYYDFLGNGTGEIVLQIEECDGYGWFNFEETKYLPIVDRMKEIIEKLVNKNLIN